VLWEAPDEDQLRFRCRIGHAFGSESLVSEQSADLDASLAAALRALREHAHLARRVGDRLRAGGHDDRAARYDRIQGEAEHDAEVIRKVLLDRGRGGT
jgi:two-component system, chemotaxis family, protein-glutamate methylesterase/glutaminase